MKTIPLSRGKAFAIVDDEDYEWLTRYSWFLQPAGHAHGKFGSRTMHKMHRIIMGVTDPKIYVDHINGNPLDNRRCNLRLATPKQNARNRKIPVINHSGYKGVIRVNRGRENGKVWRADIKAGEVHGTIGYFYTPEEAAQAYNEAAKKYHEEFAKLNEIDQKKLKALPVRNQAITCRNTSGYKGVGLRKDIPVGGKRWRAYIKPNKKFIALGYFHTPQEAARAYNEAAKQYFGEYAKLNNV